MDSNRQSRQSAIDECQLDLGSYVQRVVAILILGSVWSISLGDEQSKPVLDSEQTSVLLKQLDDPSYRVRREAFLKLRDRSIPIDEQLAKEANQEDPHRSSLAKWLIQLRKSDGPIAEQLETVSAYRSVMAGDNVPLLGMVFRNEWKQVVDLLQILPRPVLRSLADKGELEMFQEQAWASRNSWVVPLILDLYVSNDQRVAINRWWRDIGMPADWKLKEPPLPIVQLFQLEADGRIEEAIRYALKTELGPRAAEAVCIRAADWNRWLGLQKSHKLRSKSELAFQRLAVHLLLNQRIEAQNAWTEIKQLHGSEYSPAMVICALAMDDAEMHQQQLQRLDREQAFSHLHRLGDHRGAIGKMGVTEINVPNMIKLLRTSMRNGETDRSGASFRRQLLVVYQIADAEMEKQIDEFLFEEMMAKDGAWYSQQILDYWSGTSEMEKVKRFLKKISNEKHYPLSIFKSAKISEGQLAREEVLFNSAFGRLVVEPFILFEYFVKDALRAEERPYSTQAEEQAVEQSIDSMIELFSSRKPAQWKSKADVNKTVEAVRERLRELGRGESEFVVNIAEILDMSGQTQDAMELLVGFMEENNSDPNATRLLARLLVKSGRIAGRLSSSPSEAIEKAASLMKELASNSTHDVTIFLETAELLERAGKMDELDTLRSRVLSSALVGATYFSSYPAKQTETYESRAEVDQLLDRISRVFGTNYAQAVAFYRYSRCKTDPSQLDKAFRDGSIDFVSRSMNLFKLGENVAWSVFYQNAGTFALKAIADGDQESADFWIRMAFRLSPMNIDYPIDVLPAADKKFPKEVVDAWFELFLNNMLTKIAENPDDATNLNNTAWLCACCNRSLDKAKELATLAVEKERSPTYIDTLAEVEFRLGNQEKALELSLLGREMDPRDDQHRKQIRRFGRAIQEKEKRTP
jgi:hypothetical protein